MSYYQRSEGELLEGLHEQFLAIGASSRSYDVGHLWEAKRLATAVYTIIHDGGQTRSILTQLGVRKTIEFLSCADPPDEPGRQTIGLARSMLAVAETSTGPIYVPVLQNSFSKRYLRLKKWWAESLFRNRRNQEISRQNLVFSLRSQDGGSHYDEGLPDTAYLGLRTGAETPALFFKNDGINMPTTIDLSEAIPILHGHLAMMRQVAYETSESIKPILQKAFPTRFEQTEL